MYLTGKPDQPVASPGSSTRPRPISPDKPPEEQQRVPYPTQIVQAGKEGVDGSSPSEGFGFPPAQPLTGRSPKTATAFPSSQRSFSIVTWSTSCCSRYASTSSSRLRDFETRRSRRRRSSP